MAKGTKAGCWNIRTVLLILLFAPLLFLLMSLSLRQKPGRASGPQKGSLPVVTAASAALDAVPADDSIVLPPHPPVNLPPVTAAPRASSTVQAATQDVGQTAATQYVGQTVHWIFVTDCSSYMFNQGNMMLASAFAVDQPGEWTWIAFGCKTDAQKDAMRKLAHPRAKVWHAPEVGLTHPVTGKPYKQFQASNRPVSIQAWWKATQPPEQAIAVLDPDMFWLRPVHLVDTPAKSNIDAASDKGPWIIEAAKPGMGTGAMYGIGCIPTRWNEQKLKAICGDGAPGCLRYKRDASRCTQSYSSGPPWILHRDDAEKVLGSWMDQAIKVHDEWPDMLAEQASYGITQMTKDVENHLDAFWFMSNPGGTEQPWNYVTHDDWDPCQERAAPPSHAAFPPLWHACSTYDIKGTTGFRLHKDHIHKDLLECSAPLLHYPPKDTLQKMKNEIKTKDYRSAWAVCMYTNVVNVYATSWKKRFCKEPNLQPSFQYPPHSQGFLNADSWLEVVFRRGGWQDIDYKVSGH